MFEMLKYCWARLELCFELMMNELFDDDNWPTGGAA